MFLMSFFSYDVYLLLTAVIVHSKHLLFVIGSDTPASLSWPNLEDLWISGKVTSKV